MQFEPSDFTNQNTLETRFKRHFLRFLPPQGLVPIFLGGIWKSPPRIFKKHQSQNWSSYYVSNLKFVKPLINWENDVFVFFHKNPIFSVYRRLRDLSLGLFFLHPMRHVFKTYLNINKKTFYFLWKSLNILGSTVVPAEFEGHQNRKKSIGI